MGSDCRGGAIAVQRAEDEVRGKNACRIYSNLVAHGRTGSGNPRVGAGTKGLGKRWGARNENTGGPGMIDRMAECIGWGQEATKVLSEGSGKRGKLKFKIKFKSEKSGRARGGVCTLHEPSTRQELSKH